MPKGRLPKDRRGERYGRLVALAMVPREFWCDTEAHWFCECDCGEFVTVRGGDLRARTNSCGCLHRERTSQAKRVHGMSHSRTWSSWVAMRTRCRNPNAGPYAQYGAVGITVCDRWYDSFEAFLEDMGERPPNTSIDRIDGRGNYEPGNCRWATPTEQNKNKVSQYPKTLT